MLLNWVPLLVGLGFGLVPPRLLITSEVRYLSFDELWARIFWRRQHGQRRRRWWKLPLVWIDPVRGYVVAEMLRRAFQPAPGASFLEGQLSVFVLMAALLVVLAVQTGGRRHAGESLSPAGFMAGVMLALMPLQVALGAMVVGVATAIALHRYSSAYWAATVFTGLLGFVFVGKSPTLVSYLLLVSAPAWISWLRGTTLVTPVRC
jgi:hypothetical protein